MNDPPLNRTRSPASRSAGCSARRTPRRSGPRRSRSRTCPTRTWIGWGSRSTSRAATASTRNRRQGAEQINRPPGNSAGLGCLQTAAGAGSYIGTTDAVTLPVTHRQLYIDGEWMRCRRRRDARSVENPATEEVVAEVAYGSRADAKRAIDAARRRMPAWMKLTAYDRAKVLKKTADLMRERADDLART